MNKIEKLLKNAGMIFLSKGLSQFASILLLPMYTSILTTQDYGTMELINSYVVIAMPIFFLQIEQSLFIRLTKGRDNNQSIKETTSTVIVFMLFQTLIISILFIGFYNYINYEFKTHIFIYFVLLGVRYILMQYARGRGKTSIYAIGSFLTSIVNIVSSIITIKFLRLGIEGLLISYIIANFIGGFYLFYFSRIWKNISFEDFDFSELKNNLKYSIPLIPDSLSWWALVSSDKTIVSFFLGLGSNGLLSVSNKFSGILVSAGSIFNIAWIEFLAININKENSEEYVNKILDSLFRVFSSIWLLLLITLSILFPFLVKESFVNSYNLIPLLLISGYINVFASLYGAILLAAEKTKIIAHTTFLAAVMNIITHLLLIKYIGIYAAGFSTILSYLFMLFYRIKKAKLIIKLQFDFKNYIIFLGVALFVLFVYYFGFIEIKYFTVILVLVYSIILNKNNVDYLIKSISRFYTKQ